MGQLQICVAVLLLALSPTARADDLPSGLYGYGAVGEGQGRVVKWKDRAGDAEVRLTDLLATKLSGASLASESNDNSTYRLELTASPIAIGANREPLALVVAGLCVPVWGRSERHEDGSIFLEATVVGKEAADKIARELGIEPRLRTHPGYELVVTVEPKQPPYHPNEAVTLVMTIKNVGQTTVRFRNGGQCGRRDNQFSFIAIRGYGYGPSLPDICAPAKSDESGGLWNPATLKPGDTFTKEVQLTDWFKFTEPGFYRITALYELEIMDSGTHAIWNDFAVAKCLLHVAAPAPSSPAEASAVKSGRESNMVPVLPKAAP